MAHAIAHPRIAIVGGGVGGLVLLLTLSRRGIPATLYERDSGFSARSHLGGTLDLEWKTGQRALRENGLQEQFDQNSRPEGDDFKIWDAAGNLLMAPGANTTKDRTEIRPEIDRSVLRKMLLDAVPADSIKWDHGLTSARPLNDGQHELTFSNGTTTICDILVGADGAHSRIRPLLSSATPLYSGVTGAEISLSPSVVALPEMEDIRAFVGQGTSFAMMKSSFLGAQLNGDGRIRTYAWFRGPEDWVLPRDPNDARKALLEMYPGWSPMLLKLIEKCDDAAIYKRTLYYLPVDHHWEHVPGVTLIGDAAHLMSPFAGAGANLAMLDGLELGLVLAEAISSGTTAEERESAIAAWEKKMFAIAADDAAGAQGNMESFIHPDAPGSALDRMHSHILDKDVGTKHQ